MAARLNRHHADDVRRKIQCGVIIERFHKHVIGEIEMSPTQVSAGTALLDRSVAKLQQIQHSGDENNPMRLVIGWKNEK